MSNTARTNNNRAEERRMEERAANTRPAVDTRPKVSSLSLIHI